MLLASAGIGPNAPKQKFPIQWLVETHSENLLLRIQRRVRSGTISAEDVCVLYVLPGRSGAQVLRLRLDESGKFLDEWPDGFFEEGFREVFGD